MLRISEDTILVGEDVVVYCDIDLIGVVRGRDVAVEVTWFQEGVPVRPDSKLTISGATGDVGGVHSSLTFSPVCLSDMATYECHVTLTPLLGPASPVSSSDFIVLNISGLMNYSLKCYIFFHLLRAGGPSETRRRHIQGSTVRQCHGPVESVPHILLSRDICSTVWH